MRGWYATLLHPQTSVHAPLSTTHGRQTDGRLFYLEILNDAVLDAQFVGTLSSQTV